MRCRVLGKGGLHGEKQKGEGEGRGAEIWQRVLWTPANSYSLFISPEMRNT